MAVDTSAGSKFSIGPANDVANDQAAYELLSFTEVGEVESIGSFGDTYSEITFTALSNRRVRKFKGSKNAGTIELTLGFDGADTGQTAIKAALDADDDYACSVELNDGATTNTFFYFRGKIMSYVVGDANTENVSMATVSIGINSDIIEVAAT
jgi:hypothetical protein